jgi:hypothetical protein
VVSLGSGHNHAFDKVHPQSPHALFVRFDVSEKKKKSKKEAKKAPATQEVNFVGTFQYRGMTEPKAAEVLQRAIDGTWSPGTTDFEQFANQGSRSTPERVGGIWKLMCALGKIGQSRPHSIQTMNLFTHADKGIISLAGDIDKHGDVWLGGEQYALDDAFMEDAEETGKLFGDGKMTEAQVYQADIKLSDVRDAFASDATVVIYACHGGTDLKYLRKVARLFGTRTLGFSKMIRYTPVGNERRTKIVRTKYALEGSSNEVTDFHQLKPDVVADPP